MTVSSPDPTEWAGAFAALLDGSTVPLVLLALDREALVVGANPAAGALLGRDDLVGSDLAALAADVDLPADPETWQRLLDGRLDVLGRRRRFRRGDGEIVTVETIAFVLGTDGPGVHLLVGLLEPRRIEWTQRRARWDAEVTSALSDLRAALLRGERGDETLRRICAATATLMGADNAGLLAFDEPGRARLLAAGSPALVAVGTVIEIADDAFGRALRSDEPACVSIDGARMRDATGTPASGLVHSAVAPVVADGRRLGSLAVRRTGSAFTEEELGVLGVYAQGAGEALTQVRQLTELQQLRAREGIARDLHDETVQDLVAIRLGLTGSAAGASDPALRQRLEELCDDLERVTKGLRDMARDLDATSTAGDFGASVRSLARRRTGRVGMGWSVDLDDDVAVSLPPETRAEILVVLNEAVSNAVRHSDGTQLDIALVVAGGRATLTVCDDGIGAGDARRPGGRGLRNLRARATERGGACEIGPGDGGIGTCLTWWIPAPS